MQVPFWEGQWHEIKDKKYEPSIWPSQRNGKNCGLVHLSFDPNGTYLTSTFQYSLEKMGVFEVAALLFQLGDQ